MRKQFNSQKRWQEFHQLFGIKRNIIHSEIDRLPNNFIAGIRPNDENFLAMTIQLFLAQEDMMLDWINAEYHKSGLRVDVHLDECQFANIDKPWGSIQEKIIEAGGRLSSYTATPERGDYGAVVGMDLIYVEDREFSSDTFYDRFEDTNGKTYDIRRKWNNKQSVYEQVPDVLVPFSEAFARGYLCGISDQTFDIELSKRKEYEDLGATFLHQLNKNEMLNLKPPWGKLLQDTETIYKACLQAYGYLQDHKKLNPKAKMLVFSQSDVKGTTNRHAKRIKRELKRIDPNLKIVIATMKSEEDPDTTIANFEDDDNDVLILKNKGEGIDNEKSRLYLF